MQSTGAFGRMGQISISTVGCDDPLYQSSHNSIQAVVACVHISTSIEMFCKVGELILSSRFATSHYSVHRDNGFDQVAGAFDTQTY